MQILKTTEVSLLGYSYRLTVEPESIRPYAVECFKNGELAEVDYFSNKTSALRFFDESKTTLKNA